MANNPKFSNAAVNAEADALTALLASGYLRIYDGAQPANANTAPSSSNVQLAELRFGATAFAAASSGVAAANAITADTDADATGTATWFRTLKTDGSSVVMDGSCASSGADLNLNTAAIVQHAEVDVDSMSLTISKG